MGENITIKVDDSQLNDLIRKTKGKGPVRIVADGVEYGFYVEMGTSRMGAQPAAKPAVEAVRQGFSQAMQGVITLDQATAVVEKTARDVERLWKQNAAVDTGAYRNSIHVVDGDTFGVTFASMR